MKYVFHDVFYSASVPKTAQPIIDLFKLAVGSEMLSEYMVKFVADIRDMANNAMRKGRVKFEVRYSNEKRAYDGCYHGSITLYSPTSSEPKRQAALYFIGVDSLWAEDYRRDKLLTPFKFVEWDKMKMRVANTEDTDKAEEILMNMVGDLQKGVSVEEVADKYVACATPELRKSLIDGMKAIVEKGGEV